MKNALIIIGICVLFIGMPVGLSDCGCDQSTLNTTEQEFTPWLTSEDITALREQGQREGWTFTVVSENPATQRSLDQLCGLVVPDNWWVGQSFDPCTPTRDLPDRFDWRELGGCTPVKDQDGCGSCWAFGTAGALECNILIHDHKEVDLSEQWLVSCNQQGWGCNGGWWAQDYFQWKTDRFNGTGAVLEEDFPYVARDVPCDGPYPHPYRIDSWHFVGWSQGIPSTDSIKQAIMTYGPVSVAVAVTGAFGAYNGGVFNQDDPYAGINHAVVLVGWDDNQGTNGVWFLRNSWGPFWGEDGYMRIEYRCCKVGYAACYVEYPPRTDVEVRGGLLGLSVRLTNTGNKTTNDIGWSITMNGGIQGLIDLTLENTIPALQPGESFIRRIPRLGFGPVNINVIVEPSDAGKVVKNANAYLFGLLLFVSPEK